MTPLAQDPLRSSRSAFQTVQSWFFPPCAGLDLGTDSIKWSAVESKKLRSYLRMAPALSDRASQRQALGEAVRAQRMALLTEEWRADSPVWPKKVAVSLQGQGVMGGYLEFPPLGEHQLAVALPSAVAREVPFPPTSMTIAYEIVPTLSGQTGSAVFYSAILRTRVEALSRLLLAADLEATAVEPTAHSLVREFSRNRDCTSDAFVALVHGGFQWTQIVILRNQHCYYARDFGLAGGDFTRALQTAHQCDWATAESRKIEQDVFQSHDAILEPLLRRWTARVRLHLENFARRAQQPVQSVFLSGGMAAWRGLDRRLQEELQVPCLRDDWERIRPPSGGQTSSIFFKVALGLALKSV